MKVLCTVYKSLAKSDYYLFVKKDGDVAQVPEALLSYFGKYELAMTLVLRPDRRLAMVSAEEVLQALDEKGYYLQLPPGKNDTYMQDVRDKNEKL
ncbi:MAG: YcgL domain-containing protein [Porticoccaceae bacterium]|nr:YcgL domain-containing protein [Porticoccaceae bacterium]